MSNLKQLSVCRVELKSIPINSEELSEKIFRKCHFCDKVCEVSKKQSFVIQKLSGPGNFYCSFCLRHGFNSKNNREILILSFRSIIGYLYIENYLTNSSSKLWISEIEDFIESHQQVGMTNPLFLYDPETMLWFVNFSKVGNSKKKIPVNEILKTVVNILSCFNFTETIPGINQAFLYQKYKDAIDGFYSKRYRPDDRKMLIPTLINCGLVESKTCSFDKMRNFIFQDLKK